MNKEFKTISSFFCIVLLTAGCFLTSPVNQTNMNKYADAARATRYRGDWISARKYSGRAVVNARQGNVSQKVLSVMIYEYGRACGVCSDWENSEKALLESARLDKATGGPEYMPLYELLQMNSARKEYSQAVYYGEKAIPLFKAINAHVMDPIGYARFLEDYAAALEKTGADFKASQARNQAAQIRRENREKKTNTDLTPYGKLTLDGANK